MSLLRRTASALAALVVAGGCTDGDGSPDAPPGTVFDEEENRDPVYGPGTGTTTAGADPTFLPDGGGSSAGAGGRPLAPGCVAVDPDDSDNFSRIFEDGVAVPFSVSAAFARVAADAGGNETLRIGLTDGACELGVGRQLVFEADSAAVGRDVIVGDNAITAEPDGPLRVRFNDFSDPGVPEIFGTCSESSGTITFGEVGTTENALVRATWPGIRLGSCTSPTGGRSLDVEGGFALTVP